MEGKVAEQTDAFLQEIKNIQGVANASTIQQKIIMPASVPGPGVQWNGNNQDDKIRFHQMPVNYGVPGCNARTICYLHCDSHPEKRRE